MFPLENLKIFIEKCLILLELLLVSDLTFCEVSGVYQVVQDSFFLGLATSARVLFQQRSYCFRLTETSPNHNLKLTKHQ